MSEEIGSVAWSKAISERRDREQSRALVWVVGTLLAVSILHTAAFAWPLVGRFPAFVFGALGISLMFVGVAFSLRAATPAGAACGGMICLLLTFWTGSFTESFLRSGLTPLVLLFVLTFAATRAGRQRKVKAGLAEGRRGRSAAQVIANLGVAGLASSWAGAAALLWCMRSAIHSYDAPLALIGTVTLAALAEATADTVSSEIGQAFGGQPVMLTTMRRVDAGVDGAVSLLGTAAGVAAGAVVVLAGQWALRLTPKDAAVALAGGVAGLFFDSLLGATVERKGWLGNDLVNFASTLFAAGVAFGLMTAVS
ncbi:MAG: protein of unknown function transrane [Edaphobacter sp.]|nr:protein of unknown function transrane [Edaphobacter sp.]